MLTPKRGRHSAGDSGSPRVRAGIGRSFNQRRRRFWRLARRMALAAVAVALIVLAIVFAPKVFHFPVKVSLNGQTYKVAYGTKVIDFVNKYLYLEDYRGDLMAVDGSVLKSEAGGEPLISVDGTVTSTDIPVKPKMEVLVSRGEDTTETATEKRRFQQPQLKRVGLGSLKQVTSAGQVGITVELTGEESQIALAPETIQETEPVTVTSVSAGKVRPKVVALTYDDGPDPTWTEALLKVLAQEKVPATFFVLGKRAKEHPALVKKVIDAGHQVGNHSYTHKEFTKLKPAGIKKELSDTQKAIKDAAGIEPTWSRPPYGSTNGMVFAAYGDMKMGVVLWSIDTFDWRRPGTGAIVSRVMNAVSPGSIILMHDGGGNRSETASATKQIITLLKNKGYTFVTIQQMYNLAH